MLDPAVIVAGPSRMSRALGVLLAGALAIAVAPTALVPAPPPSVVKQASCEILRERVRGPAVIETRAPGLNPRYLRRDIGRGARPAR
jgi:hypothetical protein